MWSRSAGAAAQWYLYFSVGAEDHVYLTWSTSDILTKDSAWHPYADAAGNYKPVRTLQPRVL